MARMSEADVLKILADDAARRQARLDEEIAQFEERNNALPNHMRNVKVTPDCWVTALTPERMYEHIAAQDDAWDFATVRVTRAGVTTREPSHRFRSRAPRVRQAPSAPETYAARVSRLGADGDSNH